MVLCTPVRAEKVFIQAKESIVKVQEITKILELVEQYYRHVGVQFGKGRMFGCLAMRGGADPQKPLSFIVPFGHIAPESRCYEFAPEKAARLASRLGDWSSFESRDPDKNKYGGGIRLPDTNKTIGYMAWSSYPELVDEAFMLAVAIHAGLMEIPRAEFIAKKSENKFLHPILDLMEACKR